MIPNAAKYSRREVDELVDQAKQLGAAGLIYTRYTAEGVQASAKAIGEEARACSRPPAAQQGRTCSCSRRARRMPRRRCSVQLRLSVAKKENLIPEGKWELRGSPTSRCSTGTPDEKRWDSVNHPFTAPREEDSHTARSDPGKVLAKAYDVILNGWELGGGSIRIHDRETQRKVFRLLGIATRTRRTASASSSKRSSTARRRTAASRSASIGICALLAGETSIREVIPFPKTTRPWT